MGDQCQLFFASDIDVAPHLNFNVLTDLNVVTFVYKCALNYLNRSMPGFDEIGHFL